MLELKPGKHVIRVPLKYQLDVPIAFMQPACHCYQLKQDGRDILFAITVGDFPSTISKGGGYYVDNVAADIIFQNGHFEKVRYQFRCVP